MSRLKPVSELTTKRFDDPFPNEDACKAYLVGRRWPEGVRCARCGNADVYPVKNKPFRWQCTKCANAGGYQFSVLVGTIFENTNKPLKDWFRVIHLMLSSKQRMSSLQVMQCMGFGSYKTARSMCNRIRAGLSEQSRDKFAGIVEVEDPRQIVAFSDWSRAITEEASREIIARAVKENKLLSEVIRDFVEREADLTTVAFGESAIYAGAPGKGNDLDRYAVGQ